MLLLFSFCIGLVWELSVWKARVSGIITTVLFVDLKFLKLIKYEARFQIDSSLSQWNNNITNQLLW